jgi:deoxycytidylate deaminase
MERPDKVEIFLMMAYIISRLSHDAQTKHGCVITDKQHKILGCGYNGFPRGCNDDKLEKLGYTVRPGKYPWMIHSELNAILNCEHKPTDGTAYVTGITCTGCLMSLWQSGVDTVYMLDRQSVMLDDKQAVVFDEFIKQVPINIHKVKPSVVDFSFLLDVIKELQDLHFLKTESEQIKDLLGFMKEE